MKKIILSLTSALFTCAAFAQSCVSVQQVSANYATNQITFDVKWGTCNNTNHLYRVWVFVDYRPVTITTKGAWTRATIAATNRGTLVSANKGVWITGSANTTQRVTLTLNVVGNKFDWCAFAIDYPPNATMNNGVYTLKGTPPFIINGNTTWSANTYTGSCITSITDATNNPDGFAVTPPPTITGGASTVAVGSNITLTGNPTGGTWSSSNTGIATISSSGVVTGVAAGSTNITYAVTTNGCTGSTSKAIEVVSACPSGLTMNASEQCVCTASWVTGTDTGTSSFTGCTNSTGGTLKIQQADISVERTCWNPGNYCPAGWRWPTSSELRCMFNNRRTIGGFADGWYWSSEEFNSSSAWRERFQRYPTSATVSYGKTGGLCVRCVQ